MTSLQTDNFIVDIILFIVKQTRLVLNGHFLKLFFLTLKLN